MLRLSGWPEEAHRRFHGLAEKCATNGHEIEQAHARLGMAESERLLGQSDCSAAQSALALYQKVGSTWGQTHALITLALWEASDSGLADANLREAAELADGSGFHPENKGIQTLRQGDAMHQPHVPHVLVFI